MSLLATIVKRAAIRHSRRSRREELPTVAPCHDFGIVEVRQTVTIPGAGTFIRVSVRSESTGEELAVRYELAAQQ